MNRMDYQGNVASYDVLLISILLFVELICGLCEVYLNVADL